MNFVDVIDALPGSVVVSAPMTISGLTAGTKVVQIIGVTGELSVNGGSWGTNAMVQVGDTLRLRLTTGNGTSGEYLAVTVSLQTVGYLTWTVTNVNNTLDDFATVQDRTLNVVVDSGETPTSLVVVGDTVTDNVYYMVVERATTADNATTLARVRGMVVDTATVSDASWPVMDYMVTETATATDTLTSSPLDLITEAALAGETVTALAAALGMVQEGLVATDNTFSAKVSLVTENATGGDLAIHVVTAADMVLDEALASAILLAVDSAVSMVDEVALASEEVTGVLYAVTYLNGGIVEADDEAIQREATRAAWITHLGNMALSRWTALPFTEVHTVEGKTYGIAPDGVYPLDTRTGVDAEVHTGLYDFGRSEVKMLTTGVVSSSGVSVLELDAIRSNGNGQSVTTYRPARGDSPTATQYRIKFGKGRGAKYWGFVLRNVSGESQNIIGLQVTPLLGDRRI